MIRRALSLLLCLTFAALPVLADSPAGDSNAADAKKPLTLEAIFAGTSTSPPRPSQVRWTTGDRLSFFLAAEKSKDAEGKEEGGGRDLWVMDVTTGDKEILLSAADLRSMAPSPEQATTDERERTRRSRFGVAAYRWSPDGQQILFSSSGQMLLHTLESGETRTLAPSKKGVLDPKFSPDGTMVSFVHEHDIWIVPTVSGPEFQLTTGGHDSLLHGDLDWVYPEEFRVRTGYHWAPDSRHIAFLEMDQSPVPTYPIVEEVSWQATVDLQRYPKPGDPNPKVRVGIASLETRRTAWVDRIAEYIPRIDWADADHVAVQLLDRAQEELELILAKPNGRSTSVFFERDPHWIDVTKDLTFIDGTDHFLWTSQRTGLRHIYIYKRNGELVRQLTDGDYRVAAIEGFDPNGEWVYYSSNERNVLGSDLYRISLSGQDKERLTDAKGTHRVNLSPDTTAFLDTFSSMDDPGGQTLYHQPSGTATRLAEFPGHEHDVVEPRMEVLQTEDGATVRLVILAPEGLTEKRPVLVYAYGMAGFPTIRDSWPGGSRNLFHQFLVQQGYVVAQIDDRSSSIPGHKYAITADHNIGPVAAEDHRFAVDYLKTLPYVDGERMGIWGWSGGGFTAAFHMVHTDLFSVGVAGAPPTDWRLYDSIYTERYMGHPVDNKAAYDRTSALIGVENVTGRLLLLHGTHDDNVHPQNTTKMMDALIKAGKQFDVMLYPNKTHGISGKAHRLHMHQLVFDYLERHLK